MHISELLLPVLLAPRQAIVNPGPLREILKHGPMGPQIPDFYLSLTARFTPLKILQLISYELKGVTK